MRCAGISPHSESALTTPDDHTDQGAQHFFALGTLMRYGGLEQLATCEDFAQRQVPCTSPEGGPDLVPTLMLGHRWMPMMAPHLLLLMTLYAKHRSFVGSHVLASLDTSDVGHKPYTFLMPGITCPLDALMYRWPLTAAMHFGGSAATAALLRLGASKSAMSATCFRRS